MTLLDKLRHLTIATRIEQHTYRAYRELLCACEIAADLERLGLCRDDIYPELDEIRQRLDASRSDLKNAERDQIYEIINGYVATR